MSSIISNQSDFLAFIKDQAKPNGNLSIRGVARCCGIEHTSLIRGGAFKSQKLGQTITQHGFESGALVENGFPPEAVALCVEYFAYESRAKSPMAKQLARTFGSIGIKTTRREREVWEPRLFRAWRKDDSCEFIRLPPFGQSPSIANPRSILNHCRDFLDIVSKLL